MVPKNATASCRYRQKLLLEQAMRRGLLNASPLMSWRRHPGVSFQRLGLFPGAQFGNCLHHPRGFLAGQRVAYDLTATARGYDIVFPKYRQMPGNGNQRFPELAGNFPDVIIALAQQK
jgi:hypothetical protein